MYKILRLVVVVLKGKKEPRLHLNLFMFTLTFDNKILPGKMKSLPSVTN